MLEIRLLPGSEVEIVGEINSNDFMSARPQALKEIGETVEIDGFRKGKAPEAVLVKKIGADVVLEKMAVIAMEEFYQKTINERKIRAIGRPEIIITKIAENNPLGFKIKTSVLPEITLPDYKEIAQNIILQATKEGEIKINEQDVDKAIEALRKSKIKKNADSGDDVLPDLNDEFAKSLGDFENIDTLKNAIRINLTEEKKIKEKEKRRMEILDKVSESVEQEMPKYLIETEKEKIKEEIKRNIEQSGLNWGDYLNHIKKTEAEIMNDWGKEAAKRVKYGLILEEIAEKEKIEVADSDLEKEINAMMEYHKNLNRQLDRNNVKRYLTGLMRNEKIFQAMENQ